MTTAATSLLGLALPVSGELSGTWGDTVNNSLTSLLDTAVAGTTTLTTDADVTLTTTTLATNQARQAVLLCTGARTALRYITAPAQSKTYVVVNSTSGGFAVVIRGAGPTTGLTIANGTSATVAWNGSDFVFASSISTAGVTPVASGGTGAATLTANSVLIGNGTSAVTLIAPSTSGNVLSSNGTSWASTALPASFPSGGIIMWSGSIASIPSGWVICDGTSSTPDLRDRFVVGAGTTYAVAATGGSANAIVVSHTHTATVTDPTHSHSVSGTVAVGASGFVTGSPGETLRSTVSTSSASTGITVSNTTAGASGTGANLPPYYALAYIMKT